MGVKKGTKRKREREREIVAENQGVALVQHTPEAAVEEAERRAIDWMFPTDESHDTPMTIGRARFRLVLDIETMWDEPPYQTHEQVMETVRSFVLKSLASHKYIQFGGITTRMESVE
jgi:hypothetical protein